MSQAHDISRFQLSSTSTRLTPAQAKARLLNWAEESDARSLKTKAGIGSIATVGGLAILGGITIARVLAPRRSHPTPSSRVAGVGARLISWALVARVGQLLLPYAISATHNALRRRATH